MELVISMGVASVVLVLGLQLYVQTERVIDRQQVKASRLGAETDLLSLLRRDVRTAALIAPQSNHSHLTLVSLDGSHVEYQTTPEGVERIGPAADLPAPTLTVHPRFEYPEIAGRTGRVVRVSWDDEGASHSIVLHLRNQGRL